MAKCGCYVDPVTYDIEYCPLHKTAPKLLAISDAMLEMLRIFRDDFDGQYPNSSKYIKGIIAEAKGG